MKNLKNDSCQLRLDKNAKIRLPVQTVFDCIRLCDYTSIITYLNNGYFIPNINAKDKYDRTLLYAATAARCYAIVELFIQHGADPNILCYEKGEYIVNSQYYGKKLFKVEPTTAFNAAIPNPELLTMYLDNYDFLDFSLGPNPFVKIMRVQDSKLRKRFFDYAKKSKQLDRLYENHSEFKTTFTALEWIYIYDKEFYNFIVNEYKLTPIKNLNIKSPWATNFGDGSLSKSKRLSTAKKKRKAKRR